MFSDTVLGGMGEYGGSYMQPVPEPALPPGYAFAPPPISIPPYQGQAPAPPPQRDQGGSGLGLNSIPYREIYSLLSGPAESGATTTATAGLSSTAGSAAGSTVGSAAGSSAGSAAGSALGSSLGSTAAGSVSVAPQAISGGINTVKAFAPHIKNVLSAKTGNQAAVGLNRMVMEAPTGATGMPVGEMIFGGPLPTKSIAMGAVTQNTNIGTGNGLLDLAIGGTLNSFGPGALTGGMRGLRRRP